MEKAGAPAGPGRQRPRRVGFHDRDTVRREDFAALLHDWEHAMRDAELGTLRGLARTVRHAAPMRRHAQARAPDSLRRANGKSIYRGPDGKRYVTPRSANRTATARRHVRRRRAAACVRTGRRAARRRPSLVRFPCHRGLDHGAGLHKGHGAGRREYSSGLMSRVGAAHQGADPARHAGVADPRATGAGANARGTSPLPRSERHHHRSAEQGGGVT
jgi:hypothetical protein